MDQNEKGAKTYKRILQSCRVNNRPIGSEHHLFDRQHKEWQKDNPQSSNENKVRVKKIKAKKILQQSPNIESEHENLLKKYHALQKKKLADTLKCELCHE